MHNFISSQTGKGELHGNSAYRLKENYKALIESRGFVIFALGKDLVLMASEIKMVRTSNSSQGKNVACAIYIYPKN